MWQQWLVWGHLPRLARAWQDTQKHFFAWQPLDYTLVLLFFFFLLLFVTRQSFKHTHTKAQGKHTHTHKRRNTSNNHTPHSSLPMLSGVPCGWPWLGCGADHIGCKPHIQSMLSCARPCLLLEFIRQDFRLFSIIHFFWFHYFEYDKIFMLAKGPVVMCCCCCAGEWERC